MHKQRGASTRAIRSVLQSLARYTDEVLSVLWQQCALPPHCTLVAVGGYGRGQLFPHSDVDVLLLLPDELHPDQDPALKVQLERFIGACWDCGLEIGSSVRNISQCLAQAQRDVTTQTSLLESRLVCSQRKLYVQFRRRFSSTEPTGIFVAKNTGDAQRHAPSTRYALCAGANCKRVPWGLRDLQSDLVGR